MDVGTIVTFGHEIHDSCFPPQHFCRSIWSVKLVVRLICIRAVSAIVTVWLSSSCPPAVARRGGEREEGRRNRSNIWTQYTARSRPRQAWWAANRLELIRDCFKLNHPDLLNVTICVWWSAGLRVLSTFLTSNHEESLPSEEELSQ